MKKSFSLNYIVSDVVYCQITDDYGEIISEFEVNNEQQVKDILEKIRQCNLVQWSIDGKIITDDG